ncbi:MAG TPA: SCO family protein, partial [Candidatus Limnocylindrales bacterium]|nr:SCO family protein [Candidatus Limnocylindrales bacterium]
MSAVRSARPAASLALQALALVVATALTLAGLVGISMLVARPGAGPGPSPTAPSYLVTEARPAAALDLTGSDGRPFSLDAMRGRGALVFFGYTHCPDVCPATIGIVGQVIDRIGPGVGAVFVSIDPERDTAPWLADYVKYLPEGFIALTGSSADVRAAADAWGVRYARVDGEDPAKYSMTHTANVYLVDQEGLLRAVFPFGIQPDGMAAVVRDVLATPAPTVYPETPLPTVPPKVPPTAAPATAVPTSAPNATPIATPTTAPTPTAAAAVRAEVVSTSVWAGGASPVILALYEADGRRLGALDAQVQVQLARSDGGAVGAPVAARAVQPPGVAEVSYVATLDIPTTGWWQLRITVS